MTLIVSLRIPDGIVIAGDSLSTMMGEIKVVGELDVKCPNCGHEHKIGPLPVSNIPFPSTTFSYAQKIFPFGDDFGVGVFGIGQLAGKTIFFIIRELESGLVEKNEMPKKVSEASNVIGNRLQNLLEKSINDLDQAPEEWVAGGVQIVGYDLNDDTGEKEPKTFEIHIGKKLIVKEVENPCAVTGQHRVVKAIWELYKENPGDQAEFIYFSLEDAIRYAEFLIGTTAQFQQFSRTIPQVGGDIDIALITPFDGFSWIKQKKLGKTIGGSYEQKNSKG